MAEIEYVVHTDSSGEDQAVSISARAPGYRTRESGERVGYLAMTRREDGYHINFIDVERALQRRGVGTRMYELALRFACEHGATLVSDTSRSTRAEMFWEKQHHKGRAKCEGRGGSKLGEHAMRTIRGKWPCKQWRLSCSSTSLAGVRRLGKGSR